MILKRVSPRLWAGRHYITDDQYVGMVLTQKTDRKWMCSIAFIRKGRDIQDNPIKKLEGQVSEIMSEAQSIIHTTTGKMMPIIKQEVPWETITQELNESAEAD